MEALRRGSCIGEREIPRIQIKHLAKLCEETRELIHIDAQPLSRHLGTPLRSPVEPGSVFEKR